MLLQARMLLGCRPCILLTLELELRDAKIVRELGSTCVILM